MRETFGTLLQTSKDYTVDDTVTSNSNLSNSEKFLKAEINRTVRYMHGILKNYRTRTLPKTMTTVATHIYYGYPPGLNVPESMTLTIGSVVYPMTPIHSQQDWNKLQQIPVQADTIPKFYFLRQRDFGVYPTPQDAYTLTLVGNYMPINMTAADYADGTASITKDTQALSGGSTTWTAPMVGRWFTPTDSNGVSNGSWYPIATFSSTTALTIHGYYEEATLSASTYLIGESPELPEELHELIPYRVAATYMATVRRAPEKAQPLLNFFYTGDFNNTNRNDKINGGFLGFIQQYRLTGGDNSQLVEMGAVDNNENVFRNESWGTLLS
jgi:hypothetical protein